MGLWYNFHITQCFIHLPKLNGLMFDKFVPPYKLRESEIYNSIPNFDPGIARVSKIKFECAFADFFAGSWSGTCSMGFGSRGRPICPFSVRSIRGGQFRSRTNTLEPCKNKTKKYPEQDRVICFDSLLRGKRNRNLTL